MSRRGQVRAVMKWLEWLAADRANGRSTSPPGDPRARSPDRAHSPERMAQPDEWRSARRALNDYPGPREQVVDRQAEEAARHRTSELVTLARVQALDMLGERERAVATMERYLRPATTAFLPVLEGTVGADQAQPP